MQTQLADFVKQSEYHQELESILRACVHCGFCTTTCPTYQLTADELDSPRGRIYLLKQILEGQEVSQTTQYHLDRCLSCRACETACPSGVKYSRLLDLGRLFLEKKVQRSFIDKLQRFLMGTIFPHQKRFSFFLFVTRKIRFLLPLQLKEKIPKALISCNDLPEFKKTHARKMLILTGCVQQTLAPNIDKATENVLDRLGISLLRVQDSGCCGALNYHLSQYQKAIQLAKNNIDACWEYIEQGAEAIVSTASGCGVMLKDYAQLLQYDADYAKKAARFSALVKDISEILQYENLEAFKPHKPLELIFQSPCTLQHGQQIMGIVETVLQGLSYKLTFVEQGHICCGSAGVYSLTQPQLALQLRDDKLKHLQAKKSVCIVVTANIGCLTHLQSAYSGKIYHWIELLNFYKEQF